MTEGLPFLILVIFALYFINKKFNILKIREKTEVEGNSNFRALSRSK